MTLPEAVTARANISSDYELAKEFGDYESQAADWLVGDAKKSLRVEFAARELHRRLSDGSIETYVRDSKSGELMRIPQGAWRHHPFWYHTIRGGVVHGSACDPMLAFDGQTVFLKRPLVDEYLTKAVRRKPASEIAACEAWLEGLLRATPAARPKPKNQLREEAMARFHVSWREFNECWKVVNQAVPQSTWRRPGAPKKS